ncbi:hypothetical protein D9619_000496 [Psilocybe cf. subviscida]|uniref:glucan endo-1,3-beta-D-glucosidase n=1 Tax=Psilocybe cf. subviscida TaxID=2480587 RepID=A0A8H5F2J4_9AGAR|nr:hypothetical protein D9619_000496 [Psilocybe cf. subviscida]
MSTYPYNTQYSAVANNNQSAYDLSEKRNEKSRRRKWIIIGSIVGLVVLIAIGVTVGVVVSNKSKDSENKGSSSSSSGSTTSKGGSNSTSTTGGPTKNGDPSDFVKDENLRRAFYGLAYTPEGSLPDWGCSSTLESVIHDIQLMSQLTRRVRLYGGDCNQTALVLEAIKQTKVDMEVYLGNYVVDGDPTAYERQRDEIKKAIETYGVDHIAGITVGNEFMLNYVTTHKAVDANDAIADQGAAILLANIQDTRQMLDGMNLPKHIPVGNSDAGSYFSTKVLESVEYGLSNVHAWFANTTAEAAASWVNTFFSETNVQPAALLPNKPKMYIAETGWPTDSKDEGNLTNGFAKASIENLQVFLDTFVCQANADGVPYFFFEYFDEVWKDIKYGGVEGHWGLFTEERTLKKGLKIPNCESP